MSNIGNKTAIFKRSYVGILSIILVFELMRRDRVEANRFPGAIQAASSSIARKPLSSIKNNLDSEGKQRITIDEALLKVLERKISNQLLEEALLNNQLQRQDRVHANLGRIKRRGKSNSRRSTQNERRNGILRCLPKFHKSNPNLSHNQQVLRGNQYEQEDINDNRELKTQIKLNHSDSHESDKGSPKIIVIPSMGGEEEEEVEEAPEEFYHGPLEEDPQNASGGDYEEVHGTRLAGESELEENSNGQQEEEQEEGNRPPVYTDEVHAATTDNKDVAENIQQASKTKAVPKKNLYSSLRSSGNRKKRLWPNFRGSKWRSKPGNSSIGIGSRPGAREMALLGGPMSVLRNKRAAYQANGGGGPGQRPPEGGGEVEVGAGGGVEVGADGGGVDVEGGVEVGVEVDGREPAPSEPPNDGGPVTAAYEKPLTTTQEIPFEDDYEELPDVGTSEEEEGEDQPPSAPRDSPADPISAIINSIFGRRERNPQVQNLFDRILSSLMGLVQQLIDIVSQTAATEFPKQISTLVQTVTGFFTAALGNPVVIDNPRALPANPNAEALLAPLRAMEKTLNRNRNSQRQSTRVVASKQTNLRSSNITEITRRVRKLENNIRRLNRFNGTSTGRSSARRNPNRRSEATGSRVAKGRQRGDAQERRFVEGLNNLTSGSGRELKRRRSLAAEGRFVARRRRPVPRPNYRADGLGRPMPGESAPRDLRPRYRSKRSIPAPLRTLLIYGPFSKFYMTLMLHRLVKQQSSFLAQAVMAELVRRFVVPSLLGGSGSGNGNGASNGGVVPLTNALSQLKQAILGLGNNGLVGSGSTASESVNHQTNVSKSELYPMQSTQSIVAQRPNLQRNSLYESSDCEMVSPDESSQPEDELGPEEEAPLSNVVDQGGATPTAGQPLNPSHQSGILKTVPGGSANIQQAIRGLLQGNLLSQYMKDPAISANSKGISFKLPNSQTTLTVPNLINGDLSLYSMMSKMLQASTTYANNQYQEQQRVPLSTSHPKPETDELHLSPGPQSTFDPNTLGAFMGAHKGESVQSYKHILPTQSVDFMGQLFKQPETFHSSIPAQLLESDSHVGLSSSTSGGQTEQELLNNILMGDENDKHDISNANKSYVESLLKSAPEEDLLQLFGKLQNNRQFNQDLGLMKTASSFQLNKTLSPMTADSLAQNILNKTLELSLANFLGNTVGSQPLSSSNGIESAQVGSIKLNELLRRRPGQDAGSELVKDTSELLSKSFAQFIKGFDFESTKASLASGSELNQVNVSASLPDDLLESTKLVSAAREKLNNLPMEASQTKQPSGLQIILNTDSALALVDKIMSSKSNKARATSSTLSDNQEAKGTKSFNITSSSSVPRKRAQEMDTLPEAMNKEDQPAKEEMESKVIEFSLAQESLAEGGPSSASRLSSVVHQNKQMPNAPPVSLSYKDDEDETMQNNSKLAPPKVTQRNFIGQVKQVPSVLKSVEHSPYNKSTVARKHKLALRGEEPAPSNKFSAPFDRPFGNLYTALGRPKEPSNRIEHVSMETAASFVKNQTIPSVKSSQANEEFTVNKSSNVAKPNSGTQQQVLVQRNEVVRMPEKNSSVIVGKDESLGGYPGGQANMKASSMLSMGGSSIYDFSNDFPGDDHFSNKTPYPPLAAKSDETNKDGLNNLAMALNVMNMVLLNQKLANSSGGMQTAVQHHQHSVFLPVLQVKQATRKKTKSINSTKSSSSKSSAGGRGKSQVAKKAGKSRKQNSKVRGTVSVKRQPKRRPPVSSSKSVSAAAEKEELKHEKPADKLTSVAAPSRVPPTSFSVPQQEVNKSSTTSTTSAPSETSQMESNDKNHRTSKNTIKLNSTLFLANQTDKKININATSYLFQPLPVTGDQFEEAQVGSDDLISAKGSTSGSDASPSSKTSQLRGTKMTEALDEPEREHATRWNDVLQHISVNVR